MSTIEILMTLMVVLFAALLTTLLYMLIKWRRLFPYLFQFIERRDYSERFRIWPYEERLFIIIETAERESGVRLTWGAREMLRIPIIEQFEERRSIDWFEVERSVFKILDAMREDRSGTSESRFGGRNAVAVIRAFFKRFCNIPPFCSPNDETAA